MRLLNILGARIVRDECLVPIKLLAAADADAMIIALKNTGQVDDNRFRFTTRETHEGLSANPLARLIQDPQRGWFRSEAFGVLRHADVERGVRRMHPPVKEQSPRLAWIERPKIKLDEVRFGESLADQLVEGLYKIAVDFGQFCAAISALRVNGRVCEYFLLSSKNSGLGYRRWTDFLVGENLYVGWMIDGRQSDMIKICHFPQLFRNPQLVVSVLRLHQFAGQQ